MVVLLIVVVSRLRNHDVGVLIAKILVVGEHDVRIARAVVCTSVLPGVWVFWQEHEMWATLDPCVLMLTAPHKVSHFANNGVVLSHVTMKHPSPAIRVKFWRLAFTCSIWQYPF